MTVLDRSADLEQTLNDRFGLEQFRPGQREVIENVLRGRDVLCVMPTGGGKSLCYQLPAVVLPGLTLVVSPLIALMKDQVDALTQRGLRATLINSTLDPSEQRARILEVEAGRYDLVYVAPERFRSGRFVAAMAAVKPALLAVDEAHCSSEWGHDFRPDYARIGPARRRMRPPPLPAPPAAPPGAREAYCQEAGRAGRDGLPARCVLLYAPGDRMLQERFIENEYPPPEAVYRVYEFLRRLDADPIELTQAEIKEQAGIDLGEQAVGTALKLLEGAGAVERFLPRENMAIVRINAESDDPASEPAGLVDRLGPQAH